MSYGEMRSNKLFPYLLNFKKGLAKGFVSLQVGLTHECLNKCVMCQHWARPNSNPTGVRFVNVEKLIENVIKPFKDMRGETICFSGGEPFNHPELGRIIKACLPEIGIGFITSGAGTALTDEIIKDLAQAEWIRISLDAVEPEVYKKSRGPGYEQVLENIHKYVMAGCKLGFGITVHKFNYEHIRNTLGWISSNVPKSQIESIRLWFVRGEKDLEIDSEDKANVYHVYRDHMFTHDLVERGNVDAVMRQACGLPELPEDASQLRCVVPLVHTYIDASLRVFACCIHAGDAEIKPAGPMIGDMEFSNLHLLWDKVLKDEDSKRNYGDHPSCAGCITRLYTVNKTYQQIENAGLDKKNFI